MGRFNLSTSKVKSGSLIGSTGVVSSATAFSRILGLVREQVMAYFFGAGMATDAFVTAFRVPNLLRDMFAEGALSVAFVSVFKKKLVTGSDEEAFTLASLVLTLILAVVGLIVVLGIIAAPAIIYITANGFTAIPEKFDLTVRLTRIMMFYLLTVSISALVMGILNSFGRFGIPALSSAMFNLGMIVTVVLLFGSFDQPVYALALGVIVGGLGQLGIQLPLLRKIGFRFRLAFNLFDDGLRQVIKLVTPMIIGLSAGRINILISTLLASFLMEGSISYLNYSYRLMHFPMGVFAVALGTVALPRVSEMVASKDTEGLRRTFYESMSLNLFILIPSAFILALMGHEIVQVIYQWGAFSQVDANNTYLALLHYSYGLVGFATVRVIVPFYYANNDSRLPMKISIITVAVNIALYYPFIKILNFAGLAAATSIAGMLNCALLLVFLPGKGVRVPWGALALNTTRIAIAAALACYIARMVPVPVIVDGVLAERMMDLVVPALAMMLLYAMLCFIFRVPEISRIGRILFRRK